MMARLVDRLFLAIAVKRTWLQRLRITASALTQSSQPFRCLRVRR